MYVYVYNVYTEKKGSSKFQVFFERPSTKSVAPGDLPSSKQDLVQTCDSARLWIRLGPPPSPSWGLQALLVKAIRFAVWIRPNRWP